MFQLGQPVSYQPVACAPAIVGRLLAVNGTLAVVMNPAGHVVQIPVNQLATA